ncbi:MAG: DUF2269 family protein [Actinomycetota bacterium]|nr:DUF2269 family protein [Actinomycetota bacterium]
MSVPAYDILLVCHVVAGLVGFGAIAAGGLAASSARRSADPGSDEAVRRFFRQGPDWPARAIFLVPLLGLALLFGGDRSAAHHLWPWVGLGLWVTAVGVATAICWPAERDAQVALADLQGASEESRALLVRGFRDACRKMEQAVTAISLCFLAAVAVMIVKP